MTLQKIKPTDTPLLHHRPDALDTRPPGRSEEDIQKHHHPHHTGSSVAVAVQHHHLATRHHIPLHNYIADHAETRLGTEDRRHHRMVRSMNLLRTGTHWRVQRRRAGQAGSIQRLEGQRSSRRCYCCSLQAENYSRKMAEGEVVGCIGCRDQTY